MEPTLTPQTGDTLQQEPPSRLFKFEEAKIHLQKLVTEWDGEIVKRAKINRAQRKPDLDIEALQKQKLLDEDETIIPIRTINTNIEREQGVQLGYIQGSQRIVTMTNLDNPTEDLQDIETRFSRGMSYDGWIDTHARVIDGCDTHGWDTYEVEYDKDKPFGVTIEQVGFDALIFPLDAVDLQACETIIRTYVVSLLKLKEFIDKDGFDSAQVKLLEDKLGDTKKNTSLTIYKAMFKYEGKVQSAWFELSVTSDWLRKPMPLNIGRFEQMVTMEPVSETIPPLDPLNGVPTTLATQQPVVKWIPSFETEYPYFMLFYDISEEKKLISHKGRAFLDKPSQEGQTALASSVVNGCIRASQVYGSPAINTGTRPTILDEVRLQGNRMYSSEVKFWSTPWPEPVLLNSLQALGIQNAQEAGQTNYAAANKKDSRKTAEELKMAQQEQTKLSGVKLINLSSTIRSLYTFIWKLVYTRAMAGEVMSFDTTRLGDRYDIRAAGDTDVIERQETLAKMRQDWPVISATPLSSEFLKAYIKISYPNYYEKWSLVLEQGDVQKNWIQQALTVMPSLMSPEEMSELDPQIQQQLMTLMEQGKQALQSI